MPTTTPDGIFYADSSTAMSAEAISAAEATSVQDALDLLVNDARQIQTFRWADASERTSQGGMLEGDQGWQSDTKTQYVFDGTNWVQMARAGIAFLRHVPFSGNQVSVDSRDFGGDLFQSDFLNYEVVVELSSTSVATGISCLMRSSSSDYATNNQVTRRFELNTATPAYANSTTATSMFAGRANGVGGGSSRFTIFGPQAAQYTKLIGTSHDAAISQNFWNNIPNTNVFTGLKIRLDGVVTGTGFVTVYGLVK